MTGYKYTFSIRVRISADRNPNHIVSINLNCIHLIIDFTTGELFVIVEYCRFGNLLSYLTAHRHSYINQVNEPEIGLIIMCWVLIVLMLNYTSKREMS